MTVTPIGSFHVGWSRSAVPREAHLWHAASRDGGRTWTEKNAYPPRRRNGLDCECCWPFLTADNEGKLYLLFRDNLQDPIGNVRDMHVISSADDGQNWQQESRKLGQKSCGSSTAARVQGGAMALFGRRQNLRRRFQPSKARFFDSGISGDERPA